MTRKFKVLGLAFFAILALAAVSATAAQATPQLTCAKYTCTVEATGENVGENFNTEGGKIVCKVSHYSGTLTEASSTLSVHPTYTECSAFGGLFSASVNTEECNYLFHAASKKEADKYTATVDVRCPTGQSIKISAGTCKAEVTGAEGGLNQGLSPVDIEDMTAASPKDITIQPTLQAEKEENRNGKNGPIAYTVTQDGFGCPFNGTGNKTGGEYSTTSGITAIATVPKENPKEPGETEQVALEASGE